MNIAQLLSALSINGIDPKACGISTNTVDMAIMVADGMSNGLCVSAVKLAMHLVWVERSGGAACVAWRWWIWCLAAGVLCMLTTGIARMPDDAVLFVPGTGRLPRLLPSASADGRTLDDAIAF